MDIIRYRYVSFAAAHPRMCSAVAATAATAERTLSRYVWWRELCTGAMRVHIIGGGVHLALQYLRYILVRWPLPHVSNI